MLVYLVDDHAIVRRGLRGLLEEYFENDVQFKEASSVDEILSIDNKDDVDLILLDLLMEGTKDLEALVKIKQAYHQCNVVVLSALEDPRLIRRAIEQGAAGYIPKTTPENLYILAVLIVIAGGVYLPPNVLNDYDDDDMVVESLPDESALKLSKLTRQQLVDIVGEDLSDESAEKLSNLTGQQLKALIKVSQGKSNKVIASEMKIKIGTVKSHLGECNKLLGVKNRTAATIVLFKLLGVKSRTEAIYAIAGKASFDGQLKS